MKPPLEPVTPGELESWRAYIGRQEIRREILDIASLRRFAVAVGSTPEVDRRAPPLAHWAYFIDAIATDRLGSDGHPQRGGGIFPPIRLPRRMFAAASMSFREPLTLGEEAELTVTLTDVTRRMGSTGELILMGVDRRIRQEGRERVAERQTIVYRAPGPRLAPIDAAARAVKSSETSWTPSPVELFRFSAATFNAHRIHYDLPYARDCEGYPGIVVQGPLTALKLLSFAQERSPEIIRQFSFRATAPLFAGQPATFIAGEDGEKVECIRCDGAVAMSARANSGLDAL